MPDDFYGPDGPGWRWPLIGAAVLAAVVLWLGWVWWSTRRPQRGRRLDPETRRAEALAAVDALAVAHAAGRLSAREVFQHLSPLMRGFVHDVTGRPVDRLPLSELRDTADPALVAAVAWLYPEEFAADAPGAVDDGLAGARTYLRSVPLAERSGR